MDKSSGINEYSLKELNELRTPDFYKAPDVEDFLLEVNRVLQEREVRQYREDLDELPFLFVFGLPRSGTTLISQLIAHCLGVGYVNNIAARFWLAPVTGIKLSKILIQDEKTTDFRSHYATTQHLTDIHEFGYFWRYWLKKDNVSDIMCAREKEVEINWSGLRQTLLNMQNQYRKAMVFKNIYGAYHLKRFSQLLSQVLFLYIERDPLDVAISILGARKKFYDDVNNWWSTFPLEYDDLKDLPYMQQIGGQVYYLRQFYTRQIRNVPEQHILVVSYQDLCVNPTGVLQRIQEHVRRFFNYELELVTKPPDQFVYRAYTHRIKEREEFAEILEDYEYESSS